MTDRGLCVATGENTLKLYRQLAGARLPGLVEWVPGDGVLLAVLEAGEPLPAELPDLLAGLSPETREPESRTHLIPVDFDGEDLNEVAILAGQDRGALIGLLCSRVLKVKFLGFQPGFGYLEGLPPELILPRRANPRKRVPAGSVALGGGYCGIYPAAGPGGWHLIGTTKELMFNPGHNPPARLQPGDSVQLVPA